MLISSVEETIADIKLGKIVIVVDDENRENEGDFVMAAELVTADTINFMAIHGRGLICAPITKSRAIELKLDMMVSDNSSYHETAFTVSIDHINCATGISTKDRELTCRSLVDKSTKSEDLLRPGHTFPLIAKDGGVLIRNGHTEASVDLARLAGLEEAAVICEVMNEDGTMARLDDLKVVAEKFDMKIMTIKDLVEYRKTNDNPFLSVGNKNQFELPTITNSIQ
jgi:3,4-dihydroxy 2-butanone 4-phosphate synthase/GTP cyclohydrolase II